MAAGLRVRTLDSKGELMGDTTLSVRGAEGGVRGTEFAVASLKKKLRLATRFMRRRYRFRLYKNRFRPNRKAIELAKRQNFTKAARLLEEATQTSVFQGLSDSSRAEVFHNFGQLLWHDDHYDWSDPSQYKKARQMFLEAYKEDPKRRYKLQVYAISDYFK